MGKQTRKPAKLPKDRGKLRGGYVGKILRVDLTSGSITKVDLPDEWFPRKTTCGLPLVSAISCTGSKANVRAKGLRKS